jgi:nucleoside-triphosphatase
MKNILITGQPGVGKTALIRKLSLIFKEFNPSGFTTTEIFEDGEMAGIALEDMNGETKTVAHLNIKSKQSVGKLKIDIKGFEDFLHHVLVKDKKTGFYVIDEIGRIECESKKFSKTIVDLLSSEKPVLATIPEKGPGLISELKKRDDIRIFELTPYNQEQKLKELTMAIRDLLLD